MSAQDPSARIAALLGWRTLPPLLGVLNGAGEETRVIGGAVRNALLDHPVHEVDLATTAVPDVTAARAEAAGFKVVPTGLDHGTLTVVAAGVPFEVTTLREDVETDGRRAIVRFGRDFAADALRRDFTINALSVTPDGRVHDYAGGLDDLAARRVRFMGDPDTRIREDYLRILRFFRFHAEYGAGGLDRAGFDAAIRRRAGLDRLSRERVRAELLKLLVARQATTVVGAMAEAGLLGLILGGVAEHGRLERAAGDEAEPDPVRRLAALTVLSRDDPERLRERLRLSNEEAARLEAYGRLVERLKSGAGPLDDADLRRLAAGHGLTALDDALGALHGEPRPVLAPEGLAQWRRYREGEPAPVLPFRGADAVARGAPRGPQVGMVVERVRAAWLGAGCPPGWTPPEALVSEAVAAAAEGGKALP